MKTAVSKLWLVSLAIMCSTVVQAQIGRAEVYRNFRHFDLEDGLPDLAVNAVAQDTFGFIWLGTSRGIARSDGQTVQRIFPDRADSNALALSINCLVRDGNTIWAGTNQGLWEIDILADRIHRHNITSGTSAHALILNDISVDKSTGHLWLAFYRLDQKTHGGLVRYDPTDGSTKTYPGKGSAGRLSCILQDPDNDDVLWLGGYSFYAFSKSRGQLKEVVWPELPQYISFCLDITPTQGDTLLLATSSWGVIPFSRRDMSFGDPITLIGNPSTSQWTTDILPLNDQKFLVSMVSHPPHILDLKNMSMSTFSNAWDHGVFRTPRSSNRAHRLSANCLGVAANDGFYILNPQLQHFSSAKTSDTKTIKEKGYRLKEPIFDKSRHRVIVPTVGKPGILAMDPSCSNIDTLIKTVTGTNTPAYGWEATLLDDTTYAVMNRYMVLSIDARNFESEIVIHHSEMPGGLNFNNILCDKNGLVWAASKDNYFMTWDRKADKRKIHRVNPQKGIDSVNNDLIYEFSQLNDDYIFAACISGVYRIDVNSKTSQSTEAISSTWVLPPGVRAHSIQNINDSLMALGTTSGLYILNNNAQAFTQVGGNNERNNTIGELTRDDEGRVWGISQRGLILYDHKSDFYRRFTPADGLEDFELSRRQIQADSAGFVYLVYEHGIAKFKASEASTKDARPKIRYTQFLVNGTPLELDRNINTTDAFQLESTQNYVKLNFTNIDLGSSRTVYYQYNLSRFGDEWQSIGTTPSVTLAQLNPGRYSMRLRASYDNRNWVEADQQLTWVLKAPFYMQWWFVGLTLIIFAFIFYKIYRWRLGLLREQEAVKARAAEAEMQALRAQMNPHFIFNSLNSIKSFIATNDKRNAADYLSKFSKLIRLILNNSKHDWVTLTDELQALKLYIELEAIRLSGQVDYRITVSPNVESDYVEVPPLMFQPYVENAIWHGLRHKPDGGMIAIDVCRKADRIICSIEDNGVGRKKAAEFNKTKSTRHNSLGTSITQERLSGYFAQSGNASIETVDLYNPDGSAAGTKIIIEIPVN